MNSCKISILVSYSRASPICKSMIGIKTMLYSSTVNRDYPWTRRWGWNVLKRNNPKVRMLKRNYSIKLGILRHKILIHHRIVTKPGTKSMIPRTTRKHPARSAFLKSNYTRKFNILLVDPTYSSRCCRERRVSITIETNTFFDYL